MLAVVLMPIVLDLDRFIITFIKGFCLSLNKPIRELLTVYVTSLNLHPSINYENKRYYNDISKSPILNDDVDKYNIYMHRIYSMIY